MMAYGYTKTPQRRCGTWLDEVLCGPGPRGDLAHVYMAGDRKTEVETYSSTQANSQLKIKAQEF